MKFEAFHRDQPQGFEISVHSRVRILENNLQSKNTYFVAQQIDIMKISHVPSMIPKSIWVIQRRIRGDHCGSIHKNKIQLIQPIIFWETVRKIIKIPKAHRVKNVVLPYRLNFGLQQQHIRGIKIMRPNKILVIITMIASLSNIISSSSEN